MNALSNFYLSKYVGVSKNSALKKLTTSSKITVEVPMNGVSIAASQKLKPIPVSCHSCFGVRKIELNFLTIDGTREKYTQNAENFFVLT